MSRLTPFIENLDISLLYAATSAEDLSLFMATTDAIMVITHRYAWVLTFLMPRTLSPVSSPKCSFNRPKHRSTLVLLLYSSFQFEVPR